MPRLSPFPKDPGSSAFLIVGAALLLIAAPARAQQIIEVPAEPYALTQALEAAAEGSIILLTTDGGIYEDTTLYITKDVTIRAADGLEEAPVLAYRWEDAAVVGGVQQIVIQSGDLTLDGVAVGRAEADSVSIAIFYAAQEPGVIRILNSEFRNNASSALRNEKDAYIAELDSLIVEGSYFHDIGNNVIGLQGDASALGIRYVRVENTTFADLDPERAVALKLDIGSGDDSTQVIVDHVTVRKAKTGVQIKGDASVLESEIKNSIITETTKPAIRWVGRPLTVHHVLMWNVDRTLGGDAVAGEAIIEAEPMFVAPEAGNFALQAGSPALDAADDGERLGDMEGWTLAVATAAEPPELIPQVMALRQNHPNPFKTSTTIAYTIDRAADVQLDVFNLLGQRVLTVDQGVQSAGDHRVLVNAERLPAGVYLYRLSAGGQEQARTMTVVK